MRLAPATRAALEAAAAAAGKTISWAAEQTLRAGLEARRKKRRNHPMQGLTYAIAELAELVCLGAAKQSEAAWRYDPFLFDSFRLALSQSMAKLRPPGDVVPPACAEALGDASPFGPLSSPEERAAHAVTILWHNLHSVGPPKPRAEIDPNPDASRGWLESVPQITDTKYALSNARRALFETRPKGSRGRSTTTGGRHGVRKSS